MNEILDTEIYFHTFHKKSQTWLHCLSSHPFIPTDQGCRLSRGPCSGGVGEAEGGVGTLGKSPCPIYSCFEKGCRKKCTRQSRKVLWVVFSSLFFKEISKNGTRGHGRMFARAKGNNKSRFDSYSVKNKCIDHIPYYLSGLSRAQLLRQPFSK